MIDSSGTMPELRGGLTMMWAAGQALADIVVAFAFELEGDAARQPRRRTPGPAVTLQADLNGVHAAARHLP